MPTNGHNPLPPWEARQPLDHRRLNAGEERPITTLTVGRGLAMARNGNTVAIGLVDPPRSVAGGSDTGIRVYVGEAISIVGGVATYRGWSDRPASTVFTDFDFHGGTYSTEPVSAHDCIVYDQGQPNRHNVDYGLPGIVPLPLRGLVVTDARWRGMDATNTTLKKVFITSSIRATRINPAANRYELAFVPEPEDPFHWLEQYPAVVGCT